MFRAYCTNSLLATGSSSDVTVLLALPRRCCWPPRQAFVDNGGQERVPFEDNADVIQSADVALASDPERTRSPRATSVAGLLRWDLNFA